MSRNGKQQGFTTLDLSGGDSAVAKKLKLSSSSSTIGPHPFAKVDGEASKGGRPKMSVTEKIKNKQPAYIASQAFLTQADTLRQAGSTDAQIRGQLVVKVEELFDADEETATQLKAFYNDRVLETKALKDSAKTSALNTKHELSILHRNLTQDCIEPILEAALGVEDLKDTNQEVNMAQAFLAAKNVGLIYKDDASYTLLNETMTTNSQEGLLRLQLFGEAIANLAKMRSPLFAHELQDDTVLMEIFDEVYKRKKDLISSATQEWDMDEN